jgi:plastocyanin
MTLSIRIAAIVAAVLTGITIAAGQPVRAADQAVTVQGFAFAPAALNVSVGDKVTWSNKDGATHTVSSDTSGVFDGQLTGTTGTFSFTFTQAGTFAYHCNIHTTMTARVVVAAAPPAAASPAAPRTGTGLARTAGSGASVPIALGAAGLLLAGFGLAAVSRRK